MPKLSLSYSDLAIVAQAHKGKHRYAVDSLCIYPEPNGAIVATDGRGLVVLCPDEGEPKGDGTPFLLDAATVTLAMKMWAPGYRKPKKVPDEECQCVVDTDAMTITIPWRVDKRDPISTLTLPIRQEKPKLDAEGKPLPQKKFPLSWPQVVPAKGVERGDRPTAFRYSAFLMRRMLDAILTMSGDPTNDLSFLFTPQADNIRMDTYIDGADGKRHVVGVLMGMDSK